MHMTEKEAKKRFCPFTFAAPADRGPSGEGITQGGPWHCMAAECMAWRTERDWPGATNPKRGRCGLVSEINA